MNKNVVERLRIMYSSGKYDKLQLLLDSKSIVRGEDIEGILGYSVFPEVKSELSERIKEIPIAQEHYFEYQRGLRVLVERAEAVELSGNKHFPFKEHKDTLYSLLVDKMKTLKTITVDELKGFYLEDEGHEG